MIDMNGNPHHSLAVSTMDSLAKAGPMPVTTLQPFVEQCQVLATLSLAYEQRTANLIAVATAISPDGVYALSPKLTDAASVLIAERLGLEA